MSSYDNKGSDPAGKGKRGKPFYRKKVCRFCKDGISWLDYKDISTLRYYVMPVGKILPRRISGTCAKHQRMVAQAVKKARVAALLPFKKV